VDKVKTFKQHITEANKNGESSSQKIYVTQKDNDKYFSQKLSTMRNGFTRITKKVTFEADPSEVYDDGEFGYITVGSQKIYVNASGKEFEIYGIKK
jgi:Tfp pilus assembly protein PilE